MKNKKNLIIYSVIAVIIIVIVTVMLYFTTDVFKTKQQLFYKYLSQLKVVDVYFVNQYNLANEKLSKKSNSSDMKVKMLSSKINQETQVSDIQEIFTIDSKALKNALLNQEYRDFVFSNNNQTFLTIKSLKDNNTYGIIADNILGKYLSVDNSNLKDLFLKLKITDVNIVPDSITTDYQELLKIDNNTLEELKEVYFNLLYENIEKENYYKIKNKDKTEALGVSITQENLFNVIKLMLETAKNDNLLLNLIISKLQLLNYNNVSVETIQSEIQKYIDEINNNTYSSDKDYLNIFLTIKDEKISSIEAKIKYKEENNIDEENISYIEHEKRFRLNFSETNNISLTIIEDDVEIISVIVNCNYDNENINLYTEIIFYKNGEKQEFKLQYQISDYQTENIKQIAIIEIVSLDEKYQIDINNNVVLKENIQISKLTTENSVKINEMTEEELKQIKNALLNRINELYNVDLTKIYNNITSK